MNLEKKIAQWQSAGIIDSNTAAKISAHESGQDHKSILLYAVGGIGAFAVILGVFSIVAANWENIPGSVKIANNLLINLGLALGIQYAGKKNKSWLREVLIIIYFGFVLASIALIGQVYNLGGKPYQALGTWLALTLPLVFSGTSGFLALFWGVGVYGFTQSLLFQSKESWALSDHVFTELVAGTAFCLPLAFLALAIAPRLREIKPHFFGAFRFLGWAPLLITSSVMQALWYTENRFPDYLPWKATVLAGIGIALLWPYMRRLTPNAPEKATLGTRALLIFTFLNCTSGIYIHHGKCAPLAAILFIALWSIVGWTAYLARAVNLLNISTALIAIRILVVYIEVLGSLLNTGLSLLLGGMLTLGLTALWIRKSKDFRRQVSAGTGP